MTAQQLKNSILQMAVQGKLVPQDPNDEPASVLLERIRAEKEHLIKEKKIKREKNPSVIFRGADNLPYEKVGNLEPVCIADEVPFDIPDSWEWVRLGSVSTYADTKQKVNAQYVDKDMWGLDLEDIEKGGRLVDRKTVGERKAIGDKTVFSKGDILYSKLRPYLLKILIAPECGICTPEIVPFRMYGEIDTEYIVNFLKSPYVDNLINSITYGVKMPRVGTETMLSLLVPLPPLSEQKRIVAKINEAMSDVSAYEEAYDKAEMLNAAFPVALKKSILQQAIQGKLVSQDPNDEPAAVLLERIRTEKERLIKAGKIKRDKHESVIFRRDNSHYEKLDGIERCINDELPFEIPDSWEWVRLYEIMRLINGRAYKQNELLPKGQYPVLRVGNLFTNNDWYFSDMELDNDKYVDCGNLLYAWSASFGPFIWQGGKCIFHYHIWKIDYYRELDREFLYYFLMAETATIKAGGHGLSMQHVTKDGMEQLVVPLPPINEQHRIVRRIEELLPLIKVL